MQLSEFHQSTTKGKVESAQTKMTNCSSDLSLVMPDQDLVELLWENGQIVMQGQSNRPKKIPFANFSTHTTKLQDRETRDVVLPKFSPFGSTDSMVNNNFAPAVPSAPMGLNAQNDDMTPWMDYQIEESDYCSEFLSELTGVHLNPHSSTHSHTVPADRISGLDQTHNVEEQWHASSKALACGGSEPSRIRTSHLFQSRASEFGIEGGSSSSSSTHKAPCVNLQKQEVGASKPPPPPRSSGMGLMNFSHFSRPVARVRSNLLNVDRLRSHEKASTAMESTMINSTSGFKSLSTVQSQLASFPPKMELRSLAKPPPEVLSVVRESVPVHQEESSRNIPPDPANGHSSNAKADKGPEAAVASSSVCSVNSVGPVGAESNDPKLTSKRKNREGEESGYQSEDLEDESVDLKKPSTARTSTNVKRSRAAEVHNLSERRRRDRINEKMRALQELIPNCNKVDKASMLDEAIEYLKTLQLQVQIMSMGSGLCMPPMMMQHLRPPHMAHFSPMGMNMGMGMGLGYGMGGLDMNGSPGCPVFPVPPMRGPQQFPCPSMPGLHGMPGANSLQMYGIPGQGLPLSMPRAPPFCSMSGLSAQVNLMHQMSAAATNPLPVADTAHPSSSSKDQNPRNM